MQVHPHNGLFQVTFTIAEHAAGLLRGLVSPQLSDRIDWDTLKPEPSNWSNGLLEERRGDVMMSAHFRGSRRKVYFPLEHQSRSDPRMTFRDVEYVVWATGQFLRNHGWKDGIPLMVPTIVCHAPGGAKWPESFERMLDVEPGQFEEILKEVGEHLLRFRPIVWDLWRCSDDEIRAKVGTALGRFALFCVKHGREPEYILEQMPAWTNDLRKIARSRTAGFSFQTILCYLKTVLPKMQEKQIWGCIEKEIAVETNDPEVIMLEIDPDKPMAPQMAALWRRWVFEDAKAEGLAEGEQKGFAKGEHKVVQKLLGRRFGPLPDWAISKLAAASSEQLDIWTEWLLDVTSLEQLFARA